MKALKIIGIILGVFVVIIIAINIIYFYMVHSGFVSYTGAGFSIDRLANWQPSEAPSGSEVSGGVTFTDTETSPAGTPNVYGVLIKNSADENFYNERVNKIITSLSSRKLSITSKQVTSDDKQKKTVITVENEVNKVKLKLQFTVILTKSGKFALLMFDADDYAGSILFDKLDVMTDSFKFVPAQ